MLFKTNCHLQNTKTLLHFFHSKLIEVVENQPNKKTAGHCLLNLLILFHCLSLPSNVSHMIKKIRISERIIPFIRLIDLSGRNTQALGQA